MKAIVFSQTGGPGATLSDVPKPEAGMVLIKSSRDRREFRGSFRQHVRRSRARRRAAPRRDRGGRRWCGGSACRATRGRVHRESYAEYCQAPRRYPLPVPELHRRRRVPIR